METVQKQSLVCQAILIVYIATCFVALDCLAEPKSRQDHQIANAKHHELATESDELCHLHVKAAREGQSLFRELFEAMPTFVGIASAGFYEFEESKNLKTIGLNCIDSSSDSECWIALKSKSEDQGREFSSSTNSSISYQGKSNCINQKLSGSGTTEWRWTTRWDFRIVRGEGEWRNGRQEGLWTYEIFSAPCIGLTNIQCRLTDESELALHDFEAGPPHPSGVASRFEGTYRSGLRTGLWVANYNNGDATEIPYRNDAKHGTQTYTHMVLESYENEQLIDRYLIPWYEGMKHGLQVQNSWNGDREEIPWKEGTVHGESIYSWATGENEKVTWINGEQHGTAIFEWPNRSYLTILYDEGMKIGYEVLSLSPKSDSDFVDLQARYSEKAELNHERPDFLSVSRTVSRLVNGVKHGVEIKLRPVYGHRIYIPYWKGKAHGTQINVQEQHFVPYYSFYHELSRQKGVRFNDRSFGISVLAAHDGYRRESPSLTNHKGSKNLIQLLSDGSYRSHLRYENGRQQGTSIRCWYDPIPWEDEGMKGINVFDWRDGVIGYYTWPFISWHGPLSGTDPNGLCLETPYTNYKKSGIEIQTQTNGYKAHIPMRGRFLAGKLTVLEPDRSKK